MKQVLFSALFLSVVLFPGIASADHINECSNEDKNGYCDVLNAKVQVCRQNPDAEGCDEPNLGIHQVKDTTCVCNPLQSPSFTNIVTRVLNFLFNVALVLSPLMIVVGGIMFVTAGGDPARVSRAKQILIWTVVGFVVILLARGLVEVLRAIIGF